MIYIHLQKNIYTHFSKNMSKIYIQSYTDNLQTIDF